MALKLIQGKQLNTNLTGSFTGSFRGDGSFLTGVVGEWDGTLDGNAEITGSLSQGNSSLTIGPNSHAQGNYTKAIGVASHTEGITTYTGIQTAYSTISTNGVVNGVVTLDEGYGDVRAEFTINNYLYLYDEEFQGVYGRASFLIRAVDFNGTNTTVELRDTSINTDQAYVADIYNLTYSSLGGDSTIPGTFSHAEGDSSKAVGNITHAEGLATLALGEGSHTEGSYAQAMGNYSHAEGLDTQAVGLGSHAEGNQTIARGDWSHAEGSGTVSSGQGSHAEGLGSISSGQYSHAEGNNTQAIGEYSHAEGTYTIAVSYTHLTLPTKRIV